MCLQADSRVSLGRTLGLPLGTAFVHRNIANMAMSTDFSLQSTLQYAVEVLGIIDIIVCGHYGCGGVIGM